METEQMKSGVSGAFLILICLCGVGILSSVFYSGYIAIILGLAAITLPVVTRIPQANPQRTVVFSLATVSLLLGVGAIALGVVVRTLAGSLL